MSILRHLRARRTDRNPLPKLSWPQSEPWRHQHSATEQRQASSAPSRASVVFLRLQVNRSDHAFFAPVAFASPFSLSSSLLLSSSFFSAFTLSFLILFFCFFSRFSSRPMRKSVKSIPNHRSDIHTSKHVTRMVIISVPTTQYQRHADL
jgi:hypothetical protein